MDYAIKDPTEQQYIHILDKIGIKEYYKLGSAFEVLYDKSNLSYSNWKKVLGKKKQLLQTYKI